MVVERPEQYAALEAVCGSVSVAAFVRLVALRLAEAGELVEEGRNGAT